jgi:hypothetical protein
MTDIARRSANLIGAALLVPAARFHAWTGIGRPIGEVPGSGTFSPETPAGYAFSIWGPIFVLVIVTALRQALPAYRDHALYRQIGWATAGSSFLNVAWMLMAQTLGNGWWLVLAIFGILAFALVAFFRTLQHSQSLDRFDRWIVLPMTGLLAAWLSAAVWLNASSYLKLLDPDRFGLSPQGFALAVLATIAAFGLTMLVRSRGNLWYAGTLIWALAAVIAANLMRSEGAPVVALAAAAAIVLTVALAVWTRHGAARVSTPG